MTNDFRPRCCKCGERWIQPDGVDAQVIPCPSCREKPKLSVVPRLTVVDKPPKYPRSPTHGITRGRGPCKHCGIRAWKGRRVKETPKGDDEVRACCMGCDTPAHDHRRTKPASGEWILCPKCKCVSAHPSGSIAPDPTGDDSLYQMLDFRCYHCGWNPDG